LHAAAEFRPADMTATMRALPAQWQRRAGLRCQCRFRRRLQRRPGRVARSSPIGLRRAARKIHTQAQQHQLGQRQGEARVRRRNLAPGYRRPQKRVPETGEREIRAQLLPGPHGQGIEERACARHEHRLSQCPQQDQRQRLPGRHDEDAIEAGRGVGVQQGQGLGEAVDRHRDDRRQDELQDRDDCDQSLVQAGEPGLECQTEVSRAQRGIVWRHG
jgi:hypothetical protein